MARVVAPILALVVLAGCGGGSGPDAVPGEPAPGMETRVDGLELPGNAARVAVAADSEERSIAQYVLSDTDVDEVVEFHVDRLGGNGWQEREDRRADIDGQEGVRMHFGREPWETPEGVESLRFRLIAEVVQDGDDVRLTWTVVDQQVVRGGA